MTLLTFQVTNWKYFKKHNLPNWGIIITRIVWIFQLSTGSISISCSKGIIINCSPLSITINLKTTTFGIISTYYTKLSWIGIVRKPKVDIQFYFVISNSTSSLYILLRSFQFYFDFYSIYSNSTSIFTLFIPIKDVVDGFQFQYTTKIRNPTQLETSRWRLILRDSSWYSRSAFY